jgi:hypothetical protein
MVSCLLAKSKFYQSSPFFPLIKADCTCRASRGEMLSRAQTDFLATTLVKNMEVPVPTQPVP